MKEMITRLSNTFRPSGCEDAFRSVLTALAEPMADRIWVDALGNLFVFKNGSKKCAQPVAFSAYMDEPAMMIREITEEGLLRFGMISETEVAGILGKRVLVGEQEISGVIGLRPIHLTSREDRKKLPKEETLYIDLGLSKESVEKVVETGDSAVFAETTLCLGGDLLFCRGLGSAVGCGALLKLLEETPPVDLLLVFTTGHLAGNRGAYGSACAFGGQVVCVDVCSAEGDSNAKLGEGPVIPAMEKRSVFSQSLRQKLLDAGKRSGRQVQALAKVDETGDGAVYRSAGAGMDTASIYLPVKHGKGAAQLCSVQDAEGLLELLREYLNEMEDELV